MQPVVERDGEDPADSLFDLGDVVGEAVGGEVDVPGWSARSEGRHEHAALEHEVCSELGCGEPSKETFERVQGDVLGRAALLPSGKVASIVVGATGGGVSGRSRWGHSSTSKA